MSYRLKREVVDGVVNISLGMPEADAYLKFVRDRCRLNTLLSYGYDLQVFLNSIQKPVLEITPLDILAFIESQQAASNRQGRTNGLSIKGPGLSTGQSNGGLPRSPVSTSILASIMTSRSKRALFHEAWSGERLRGAIGTADLPSHLLSERQRLYPGPWTLKRSAHSSIRCAFIETRP